MLVYRPVLDESRGLTVQHPKILNRWESAFAAARNIPRSIFVSIFGMTYPMEPKAGITDTHRHLRISYLTGAQGSLTPGLSVGVILA